MPKSAENSENFASICLKIKQKDSLFRKVKKRNFKVVCCNFFTDFWPSRFLY